MEKGSGYVAVGDRGHPAVAQSPCAECVCGGGAEEVTLGDRQWKSKGSGFYPPVVEGSLQVQANVKRGYFRIVKAKDGWEHMGTRDGKLVLRLSCIRVQFGEAAERRGGRLLP